MVVGLKNVGPSSAVQLDATSIEKILILQQYYVAWKALRFSLQGSKFLPY